MNICFGGAVFPNVSFFDRCVFDRVSLVIPPCQKSRYATYFDVAVLRCLLQPHWSEEGTQWSLMYYLQRLRHMLEEKPEKPLEPEVPPLPRPRSSSMVAAAPSLVNTHKTQVRIMSHPLKVWCQWSLGLGLMVLPAARLQPTILALQ